MKLSTRGRYGVRILLDLLLHRDGGPRLIRDIARSQQISAKYVSTLMVPLRRAGLVESVRGVKGGFRLARDARSIPLLDIIEVMEGALSIVGCVVHPKTCRRSRSCPTRNVWSRLNGRIRDEMRAVSLFDLLEK